MEAKLLVSGRWLNESIYTVLHRGRQIEGENGTASESSGLSMHL